MFRQGLTEQVNCEDFEEVKDTLLGYLREECSWQKHIKCKTPCGSASVMCENQRSAWGYSRVSERQN